MQSLKSNLDQGRQHNPKLVLITNEINKKNRKKSKKKNQGRIKSCPADRLAELVGKHEQIDATQLSFVIIKPTFRRIKKMKTGTDFVLLIYLNSNQPSYICSLVASQRNSIISV